MQRLNETKLIGWTPCATMKQLESRKGGDSVLRIEGTITLLKNECETQNSASMLECKEQKENNCDKILKGMMDPYKTKDEELIEIVCNGHSTVSACSSVLNGIHPFVIGI